MVDCLTKVVTARKKKLRYIEELRSIMKHHETMCKLVFISLCAVKICKIA